MTDKPRIEALHAKEAVNNFEREGFEGNRTIFGKILSGRAKAKIVYEDDQVLCFKDIFPASENHFLVIPKVHIKHYQKLTPDDLPLLRHVSMTYVFVFNIVTIHRWSILLVKLLK